jgi:hypothetical protein
MIDIHAQEYLAGIHLISSPVLIFDLRYRFDDFTESNQDIPHS